MHITLQKIKEVRWGTLVQRNKYALVSLVILAVYCWAVFWAIAFIITRVRAAFNIDEQAVESQIITFDLEGYEKIAKRFNLER